jgi:hypothetical protein
MFLSFPNVPEPIKFDNGRLCVDEPGLYCLVECMDDPFGTLTDVNLIVERRTKTVSIDVPGSGPLKRITDKCLYLVSVDSIYGPMAGIPNVGGDDKEFILIRPFETWSEGFSSFLNGGL